MNKMFEPDASAPQGAVTSACLRSLGHGSTLLLIPGMRSGREAATGESAKHLPAPDIGWMLDACPSLPISNEFSSATGCRQLCGTPGWERCHAMELAAPPDWPIENNADDPEVTERALEVKCERKNVCGMDLAAPET